MVLVGYNGSNVICSPRFKRAIQYRMNYVDIDKFERDEEYEWKLFHFSSYGFRTLIPRISRRAIKNARLIHLLKNHSTPQNTNKDQEPIVYDKVRGLARFLILQCYMLNYKNVGFKRKHKIRTIPNTKVNSLKWLSDFVKKTLKVDIDAADNYGILRTKISELEASKAMINYTCILNSLDLIIHDPTLRQHQYTISQKIDWKLMFKTENKDEEQNQKLVFDFTKKHGNISKGKQDEVKTIYNKHIPFGYEFYKDAYKSPEANNTKEEASQCIAVVARRYKLKNKNLVKINWFQEREYASSALSGLNPVLIPYSLEVNREIETAYRDWLKRRNKLKGIEKKVETINENIKNKETMEEEPVNSCHELNNLNYTSTETAESEKDTERLDESEEKKLKNILDSLFLHNNDQSTETSQTDKHDSQKEEIQGGIELSYENGRNENTTDSVCSEDTQSSCYSESDISSDCKLEKREQNTIKGMLNNLFKRNTENVDDSDSSKKGDSSNSENDIDIQEDENNVDSFVDEDDEYKDSEESSASDSVRNERDYIDEEYDDEDEYNSDDIDDVDDYDIDDVDDEYSSDDSDYSMNDDISFGPFGFILRRGKFEDVKKDEYLLQDKEEKINFKEMTTQTESGKTSKIKRKVEKYSPQ